MSDILGKALLDYYNGNYSEDILTETNISEEDVLPLPYFFRSFKEMPKIEQRALQLCKGKILDVGCGAGSHAVYLQQKGLTVTAIDISAGAIEVTARRGVINALKIGLLEHKDDRYDTILLLMNGTGIFERLSKISSYLQHLKSILAPKGQVLIDSSDLQYMYDLNENGSIWVPENRYYGELDFTMSYKGEKSDSFPWLYLGERIFSEACLGSGFNFEILEQGENYDYLARLTVAESIPS